jgi:hypothetical protein
LKILKTQKLLCRKHLISEIKSSKIKTKFLKLDLRRCTKSPCGPNCVCIEKPQNMSYECKCENNSTTTSYTTSTSTSTSNKIRQSTTCIIKNFLRKSNRKIILT